MNCRYVFEVNEVSKKFVEITIHKNWMNIPFLEEIEKGPKAFFVCLL